MNKNSTYKETIIAAGKSHLCALAEMRLDILMSFMVLAASEVVCALEGNEWVPSDHARDVERWLIDGGYMTKDIDLACLRLTEFGREESKKMVVEITLKIAPRGSSKNPNMN